MKRIFTMAIVGVAIIGVVGLTACADKGKNKQWDVNAMVSLRAASVKADVQSMSKANPAHLTPLEIVKQASEMRFWNTAMHPGRDLGISFGPNDESSPYRDYKNERLLMWGTDIIKANGTYRPDFIEATDIIFVTRNPLDKEVIADTIAYIPNKTIQDAQKIIKPAYDAGEYDLVYATFDEAFRFIPITGAEWLELKRQGKN